MRMGNLSLVSVVVLVGTLWACGGAPTEHADSCLTPGATYEEAFTETSGDCGQIPNVVVNVSPDGTIVNAAGVTCTTSVVTGCTVQNSDCTWSNKGFDFTMTSSITISSDGSSGRGELSLGATGAASCASSYNVYVSRQ
jgi:hypothetical protein